MKNVVYAFLFILGSVLILPPGAHSACAAGICNTALGPVPTDVTGLTVWILAKALGLSGGIAFLLMVSGAIKILTSAGDPQNIKSGTESIFSAIQGLIFIIFSLFLLKLIGVDILQIPAFG